VSGLLDLAQSSLVILGVALLIGVATGRWMFRRQPGSESDAQDTRRP
jgi:hypothetical protein